MQLGTASQYQEGMPSSASAALGHALCKQGDVFCPRLGQEEAGALRGDTHYIDGVTTPQAPHTLLLPFQKDVIDTRADGDIRWYRRTL